tara:strand:- start:1478 stop:2836 length:1359 start_codon:yes stop_codon:yes gene_type:complete
MNNKNLEVSKMYSGMSEREVLGCMLLDDSTINEVIKYIPTKQVFYHKDHQNIWSAIYSLHKQNKKIDLSVVANYLGEKGLKITYYLSGITEQIVSKGNLNTHAKIIYDLYLRRELWNKVAKFQQRLKDESSYKEVATDVNMLGRISDKFADMLDNGNKSMDCITEEMEEAIFAQKNLLQTGLRKVDKSIVGMTKGEISIIAGRPGNGKSTLALNMVKNMILDGKKVMLVSREMPNVEIIKKLVAMHTNVRNKEMRGNAHKHKEEIKKGLEFIKKHYTSLHLFDNLRSLDDSINEAKKIRPDVIIDDHVGFIEFPHYDNRDTRHRIAEITRRYKWLAKEIDCSVILVSQLNRNIEHRVDKIPRLSDLAESGNLEQDAEIVVFTYYPYVYEYDNAEHGEHGLKIIIAKNRYGTTCKFDMGYHGDSATILDNPAEAIAKSEGRELTTEEVVESLF